MEVVGKPLLAHALERAALVSDEALIVTNQDHYFLTEKLLRETERAPRVSYLLEPKGRNTAPLLRWLCGIFKKCMAVKPFVWCWQRTI